MQEKYVSHLEKLRNKATELKKEFEIKWKKNHFRNEDLS